MPSYQCKFDEVQLSLVARSDAPIVYGIVQPGEHIQDGVPFVQSRDVGARIDLSSLQKTAAEISDAYQRSKLMPGDILFSLRGNIGESSVAPNGLAGANIARGIARIRVRVEFDADYVRHALQSPNLQRTIARNANGSTFREISIEELRKLPIPSPPLPEQRKIAEILRTWDEAIDACERLRLKKIGQATWFRTDLFTGKVRLKGMSGEWRKRPLATALTEHGLRSAGSEEVYSVSVHKGLVNQIEHLGRSFAAKETRHYNRVLPGDIVYTKSPTGDFPLGIIKQSKLDHDVIVSPLYGVFTPVTRDLGVILDAYFRSPVTVRNYLAPLVQKGAKNTIAITNSRFLEGELTLPLDPKEHRAIAEVIEDADAEIAGIESQMAAYQAQKRGLMQKLLTGEWRVKMKDTAHG